MHLLYSILFLMALIVSSPWWLLRMLRHGKYRAGLRERLGCVPARLRRAPGGVWMHAVSVGEVLAIVPLARELRERLPGAAVYVSTTTATGQRLARERFGEENVFYFPLDLPFAVGAYFRALQPRLVVVAETEFWPNFLRVGHLGAAVAVVNARISDRSLPRYRYFRALLAPVLGYVDLFCAQGAEDARRLREIGADPARVQVTGNLKFDIAVPPETGLVRSLRAAVGPAPVLVCGSTVEGEEPLILAAFAQVCARHPDAVLLLAPRHPERFAAVAELARSSGHALTRRSEWSGAPLQGGVLLVDTIGELASLYSLATVAFVGGSLVPRGGHNILEPAQAGVPIIVGPHTENFRDIVSTFARENALVTCEAAQLASCLLRLLDDSREREGLGGRAREVFQRNAGATQRTVSALEVLLKGERT